MTGNTTQFLVLLSAISISLAALASLVNLFRTNDKFSGIDIADYMSIIISSFAISLGSILPFILIDILPEPIVWSICSLAFSIVSLALLIEINRAIPVKTLTRSAKILALLMRVTSGFIGIILILNTIFFHSYIVYEVGLFWGFGLTCLRLYGFLGIATNTRI